MKIYTVLRMSGVGRKMATMVASVTKIISNKIPIVMVQFILQLYSYGNKCPNYVILTNRLITFLTDSIEICESSSGKMSLSCCQLFKAGFLANNLHLHDPNCNGTVQDGRLVFHFDNDDHICGTNLTVHFTVN